MNISPYKLTLISLNTLIWLLIYRSFTEEGFESNTTNAATAIEWAYSGVKVADVDEID